MIEHDALVDGYFGLELEEVDEGVPDLPGLGRSLLRNGTEFPSRPGSHLIEKHFDAEGEEQGDQEKNNGP